MSISVQSHAFSTQKNANALPLVDYRLMDLDSGRYRRQLEHFDYYWGLCKGELDLRTPLNHIQLRSDMAKRLDEQEWTLLPTKETMDAMIELSEFNKTVDVSLRRAYFEDLPETEYEYEFVPLYIAQLDRPALYIDQGATTKTVRAPYYRMPRIRSRAHPLFVIFRADDSFSSFASTPRSKARRLTLSVGAVVHCWLDTPPPEFLVGPDVWKKHRHPLSDDGSVACSELKTRKATCPRGNGRLMRKSTKAPCPQPKARKTRTSVYDCKLRPIRQMTSALPLYESGCSALSEDSGLDARDLSKWADAVKGETGSAPHVGDRQLAAYQKEAARDPANALRLDCLQNTGGIIMGSGSRDRSNYSSNDWALRVFDRCLWSSNPAAACAPESVRPWS
ncbi:hypothetical protein BD626DRAFT_402231 [Schizophyllum amplum]|uniref:Uncharacterized protein n=1 Tax=Schizophyllum amplum TaxID=97359 RepID=A0A550CF80_9AGAR|nr:hypothetical protein BD626DRAFT_402231 [Auriculariopsis ampla]